MPALPPLATEAINAFITGFIVLNVIIGMVTYVTLLERKFAARMQSRIGPYRVGPHGLLQPIADAVKLMMKEDVVPRAADRSVYNLAPIVFLVPCMLIFATLPIAPAQAGLWYVAWFPLGTIAFLFYIVTTLAAENRVPFDILEAESELIAGFRVEYSGMKFALIQLGEYAHVIATSFLGALLFLGAWGGPGAGSLPALGAFYFLLKAMFVFL